MKLNLFIFSFILLIYKNYAYDIQTSGYDVCSKYKKNNSYCLEPYHGCLVKPVTSINNTLIYSDCYNKTCFPEEFLKYPNLPNYNNQFKICIGAKEYP